MTTNQTLWLDQGGLRVGANQLTTSGSGVGVGTSSIYGSFTAGNGAVFFGAIGIGGANYGTSGQVLTSGGASAAPSWTNQLPSRSIFTASGTWTKPAGASLVLVRVWGAGGGGSGGEVGAAGLSKRGSGGGGGAYFEKYFYPSVLSATVAVTVGAAGTGGASNTNGGFGGNSSFGAYIVCEGGWGGWLSNTFGNGGGAQAAGQSTPSITVPSLTGGSQTAGYYGGGAGGWNVSGFSSQFGGGGGGSNGWESGGGLQQPGAGGQSNYNTGVGAAGTSSAGAPTVGGAATGAGCGGGGGGSATTVNGAAGGAGGFPGGGGGGGGTACTGFLGGKGGAGGAGYVEVYTW